MPNQTIASLLIKISAQDKDVQDALAKIGQKAKSTDADLRKIGNTPLAEAARKSLEGFDATLKEVTDRQQKLADKARDTAHGLDAIGGPARLMKTELDQVSKTIERGLDAFRALGQQAPAELQRVAKAVEGQRTALAQTSKEGGGFLSSLGGEIAKTAAGFFTAQAAISAVSGAFHALVGAGQDAIDFASHLDDLSKASHVDVESLQELGFAGKRVGLDLGETAGLVGQLTKRLATGDDSALAAVQSLGLSWNELRTLRPDQIFEKVATAVAGIQDPLAQSAVGTQLFGREFEKALRLVNDGLAKTRKEARDAGAVLGKEVIASLDAFGDKVGDLTLRLKVLTAQGLGPFVAAANELFAMNWKQLGLEMALALGNPINLASNLFERGQTAKPLAPITPVASHGGPPTLTRDQLLENRLTALRAASLEQLDAAQKKNIASLHAMGEEEGKIAPLVNASVQAVHLYIAALDKAKQENDDFAKAFANISNTGGTFRETFDTIDGTIVEAMRSLKAGGASIEDLARVFKLTKDQANAFGLQLQFEASVADATDKAFGQFGHTLPLMSARFGDLHDDITGVDHVTGNLKSTVIDLDAPMVGLADATKTYGSQAEGAKQQTEGLRDQLFHLRKDGVTQLEKELESLAGAFARIAQVSGGAFSGVAQDIATVVTSLDLAVKSVEQFKQATTGLQRDIALLGGIGAIGGATARGSTASRTIGGALTGAQVGSLFGPIGTGIGAAVGGLTGLFRGIFGGNPEKEVNKIRDQFVDSFKTVDFSGVHKGIDILAAKAKDAGVTLDHLLNAKNMQQYQAAVDELNVAFAKHEHELEIVKTGVDKIVEAAKAVGGTVPAALRPMIEELLKMQGLTEDERKSLLALTQDVAPDFETLEKRAEGFGITIEQLGPAFEQAQIERRSKDITSFLEDATRAGGDVGGMLFGLSDEISKLVQDAKNFGVAIPENMRPFIQNLADTGHLLDDNGHKITDLTGIKWEDTPIDKGSSAIVDAIHELRDTLLGLPGAAKQAATGIGTELGKVDIPTIHLKFRADVDEGFKAATGGLVTAHGIQRFGGGGRVLPFLRRGTDTVPAMLTPGEIVLNDDQQQALAGALSGGGVVVQFTQDNRGAFMGTPAARRAIAQMAIDGISREIRARRKLSAR